MPTCVKLEQEKTVRIEPTSPFAFDPTFHKPVILHQVIIFGSPASGGKHGCGKARNWG
jgi:hypothetical protein